MDSESIQKALSEAKALVASLEKYDGTPEGHLSLLRQTDKVRTELEEPYDVATRLCENLSVASAIDFLIGMDVFEMFPDQGNITAAHLASHFNIDISMITRTFRVLIINGIFEEVGKDEYTHNLMSKAFHPLVFGGVVYLSVDLMKTWINLPNYAKTHQPIDLYDNRKTPFAVTLGHEGKKYYEVVDMDVKGRAIWNATLANMAKNFPILGMFPFKEMEEQVRREPERPFIVDIGGGRGQASLVIREYCGGTFGSKIILQDLPTVIETLKPEELPDIEPMVYDAFTQQPVQDAIAILKNTASAMAPDSRLIIGDMLVPDRVEVGGPMTLYWLDFALLAIGGKERSLDEFKGILAEAGLELFKVYHSKGENIVMLEARLIGSD
ncbi:hypothetical protein N7462_005405 [Penicillium macrosclerotiorum]|uniref:uncharacterized protein n=1 Tax=Penicillium macrosclerotiorum TaxID=303699 RepID=UPI002548E329|nr:uncharacterized protein N7462_005405 [Penicillium macrosclerotiorum]KAJ5682240.1 hypothetical protein N7462_005405 [Penicillium macrosclerotiorum]